MGTERDLCELANLVVARDEEDQVWISVGTLRSGICSASFKRNRANYKEACRVLKAWMGIEEEEDSE